MTKEDKNKKKDTGRKIKEPITKEQQRQRRITRAFGLLFVLYLLFLFYILLGNALIMHLQGAPGPTVYHANLIPLKSIRYYLNAWDSNAVGKGTIIYNLLGNLVLLMPMGPFLLCLFRAQKHLPVFLLTVLLLDIYFEVSQMFIGFRNCDIDDVILNTLGALLSFIWCKTVHITDWFEDFCRGGRG